MLYSETLKDPKVFSRIYRKGQRSGCACAAAYYQKNRSPYNRVGVTVPKKIGGAVERNRAKRIIRAAYRKNELLMPLGYDIVIVAGGKINGMKSTDLDILFRRLSKDMKKSENPVLRTD